MRRVIFIFLTQLLLWVLVAQANHALSGFHLYLFVGALFVAYPALALPLREGMIVSFLGGLLCDANVPLPANLPRATLAIAHTQVLLFLVAHTIVYYLRDRIPREETVARVMVALFTNLGIFLLFSLLHLPSRSASREVWPPILIDLVFSQLFLVLITPWFFSLQERILVLTGVERESISKSP